MEKEMHTAIIMTFLIEFIFHMQQPKGTNMAKFKNVWKNILQLFKAFIESKGFKMNSLEMAVRQNNAKNKNEK